MLKHFLRKEEEYTVGRMEDIRGGEKKWRELNMIKIHCIKFSKNYQVN